MKNLILILLLLVTLDVNAQINTLLSHTWFIENSDEDSILYSLVGLSLRLRPISMANLRFANVGIFVCA